MNEELTAQERVDAIKIDAGILTAPKVCATPEDETCESCQG